jgi:hypothetical protein
VSLSCLQFEVSRFKSEINERIENQKRVIEKKRDDALIKLKNYIEEIVKYVAVKYIYYN